MFSNGPTQQEPRAGSKEQCGRRAFGDVFDLFTVKEKEPNQFVREKFVHDGRPGALGGFERLVVEPNFQFFGAVRGRYQTSSDPNTGLRAVDVAIERQFGVGLSGWAGIPVIEPFQEDLVRTGALGSGRKHPIEHPLDQLEHGGFSRAVPAPDEMHWLSFFT